MLVRSNSSHWLKRYCAQTFYFINKDPLGSFLSIYNVVTLKIRARSAKSNHFFPPIDEYPSLHFQDIKKKKTSITEWHTNGHTDWPTDGQTMWQQYTQQYTPPLAPPPPPPTNFGINSLQDMEQICWNIKYRSLTYIYLRSYDCLNNLGGGPPRKHFCQVILKLVQRFLARRFLKFSI